MTPLDDEARVWAARAPDVPRTWFLRDSTLHGVRHTQRVHIHAQRLTRTLSCDEPDRDLALSAALWHDIGRTNDGVEPGHGAGSAARAARLGLSGGLAPSDAEIVLFAVHFHSLSDRAAEEATQGPAGARRPAEPERALRILWLLKDADALDRVRLAPWEAADPKQLRHPETAKLIPFAARLFAALD